MKEIDSHRMIPEDFNEWATAAAIRIHPSAKFLYASTRGYKSVSVFEILDNGNLKKTQTIQEGIEWPRDYNVDPSGKYMIVANRWTNELRVYAINDEGKLTFTESSLEIPQPTSVEFLK